MRKMHGQTTLKNVIYCKRNGVSLFKIKTESDCELRFAR